jgi:uncharacterized membrane protein YdjX (TVP38/TMEM64 family)
LTKLASVRKRQAILVLLIAVLLIGIVVGTLFVARAINPHIKDLGKYGYLGVFLLGLIINASVIVPVPIIITPILTGLANEHDPYSIAVVYALGATFGESVSYGIGSVIVARIIGRIGGIKERIIANISFYSPAGKWLGKYSGLTMLREEHDRKEGFYQRLKKWSHIKAETWLKKYRGWAIFILAIQPIFPFDIAGIVAGAAKYPYYKFLIFCFAGRIIKYIIMIVGGISLWRLIFD